MAVPESDLARLVKSREACWLCERNTGEPVYLFMGRAGHVRCIQRQAAPSPFQSVTRSGPVAGSGKREQNRVTEGEECAIGDGEHAVSVGLIDGGLDDFADDSL